MLELCFVAYRESGAHEDLGLGKLRTSAIRSHARRAAHRQVRQERTNTYQKQSPPFGNDRHQKKGAIVAATCLDDPVATGSPASYLDSLRRDPFQSLALPVNDVEQMLIDFYVTTVAPYPTPDCTVIIPADTYAYQVTTQWVPFAIADQCLLNGLLLQICRKFAALQGHAQAKYYEGLALKYKIACIRSLRPLVSSGATPPSDTLIAGSLFLALDEIEEQNMNVATSHVRAIELMVQMRGGKASLGLEGFLGRVVSLCKYHVGNRPGLDCIEDYAGERL